MNLPAFFPGAMRLAAAAQAAGFTQERVWPQVTDPAGVKWNPSGVLMALAICGAESSGNAWATHQNSPASTDFGPWQVNDQAWPHYFDGSLPLSWARFWDNAIMAHAIYTAAGFVFTPWKGYTNGNWKSWRDENRGESWLAWGHSGVLALNKALAAGQSLGEIASVNLDVAP